MKYYSKNVKRKIPYPLEYSMNENECKTEYMSSLNYSYCMIDNTQYVKQFFNELNKNYGEHQLIAFTLMACLTNYPPIFIVEDLEFELIAGIESKIISDNDNNQNKERIWQALNKLSDKQQDDLRGKFIYRNGRCLSSLSVFIESWLMCDRIDLLKEHKINGKTQGRKEWYKTLQICPITWYLNINQDFGCHMFRLDDHINRSGITFLRIQFVTEQNKERYSDYFEYGHSVRYQVYDALKHGISITGCLFELFFYSDGQIREKKAWFYSCQLSKHYVSIKSLRNSFGDFSSIQVPGKKFARIGLYATKTVRLKVIKSGDIEYIDDIYTTPKNNKDKREPLTDGASVVLDNVLKDLKASSCQSRVGGAKCMLVKATKSLIKELIKMDQSKKQDKYTELLKHETNANVIHAIKQKIELNKYRNYDAKVLITKSSRKFDTKQKNIEIAVKDAAKYRPAYTNKEFLGVIMWHYKQINKEHELEKSLQKYAKMYFDELDSCTKNYRNAFTFIEHQKNKGQNESILHDFYVSLMKLHCIQCMDQDGYYSNDKKQQDYIIKHNWGKCNKGMDCPILKAYLDDSLQNNDYNRIKSLKKHSWGNVMLKLRVKLDWPSGKIKGVCDFTQILKENEIFWKIKIPLSRCFPCTSFKCKQDNIIIPAFESKCQYCNQFRPEYYVHQGLVGVMKNPCLHPRGYRLFTCVKNSKLDEFYKYEALAFSANNNCQYRPVYELAGADFDGDEFMVITQKDLLPLKDINDRVDKLDYDDGINESKYKYDYVDDERQAVYFLEYQLLENQAQLADLHEAFTQLSDETLSNKHCLNIAKAHASALDFPKTGVPGKLPDGIPSTKEIMKHQYKLFPHYMTKKPLQCRFTSKKFKGRFFDLCFNEFNKRTHYRNDETFTKEYHIPKILPPINQAPIGPPQLKLNINDYIIKNHNNIEFNDNNICNAEEFYDTRMDKIITENDFDRILNDISNNKLKQIMLKNKNITCINQIKSIQNQIQKIQSKTHDMNNSSKILMEALRVDLYFTNILNTMKKQEYIT